jgi:hypothetical protein
MDTFLAFVGSFFSSLWGFIKLGLMGFFSVISTFVYMILDGLLTVVTLFVTSLDLSALVFTQYAQWTNLPPQAIYLVNQLALPQCASLIAGAMIVRLLLNLIPAAVTRV